MLTLHVLTLRAIACHPATHVLTLLFRLQMSSRGKGADPTKLVKMLERHAGNGDRRLSYNGMPGYIAHSE